MDGWAALGFDLVSRLDEPSRTTPLDSGQACSVVSLVTVSADPTLNLSSMFAASYAESGLIFNAGGLPRYGDRSGVQRGLGLRTPERKVESKSAELQSAMEWALEDRLESQISWMSLPKILEPLRTGNIDSLHKFAIPKGRSFSSKASLSPPSF